MALFAVCIFFTFTFFCFYLISLSYHLYVKLHCVYVFIQHLSDLIFGPYFTQRLYSL